MKGTGKIITSHRSRVKRAKDYFDRSPYRISKRYMEAYVEYYLLEDVERLFKRRLHDAKQTEMTTHGGQLAQKATIDKLQSVVQMFGTLVEVGQCAISGGYYKEVSRAIPEHSLMVAAENIKYLSRLAEMAKNMLDKLLEAARAAGMMQQGLDESIEDLERHDANTRTYYNLPSAEEVDGLMKAMDSIINSDPNSVQKKQGESKDKPNIL